MRQVLFLGSDSVVLVIAPGLPVSSPFVVPFGKIPVLSGLVGIAIGTIAAEVVALVGGDLPVLGALALVGTDVPVQLVDVDIVLVDLLHGRVGQGDRAGH